MSYCVVLIFLLITTNIIAQDVRILVNDEESWKYLDDGSNQGTAWKEIGFNDDSWMDGLAALGFIDEDDTEPPLATILEEGHITYYFRHKFDFTDPEVYDYLKLYLQCDDGAVIYLNGFEICRFNIDDPIHYTQLATVNISSEERKFFNIFDIDINQFQSLIIEEDNVIAVEVHQKHPDSSDVVFDLRLVLKDDYIKKAPYLIYIEDEFGNEKVQVLWQLNNVDTCTLEWGLDTNYSTGSTTTSQYNADHQHSYSISGLADGTVYFYRVTVGANDYVYTGSFRTKPNENTTSLDFFVYGDTRTYPKDQDDVAAAIINAYGDNNENQSMLISVGDIVQQGDDPTHWDMQLFDTSYTNIYEMLSTMPFHSVRGNHELGGILFENYFPYPYEVDPAYDPSYYYSFDYGPVHFMFIDQYLLEIGYYDYINPEQLVWIEDDLANTDKNWKIVVIHEPGWSAGGHDPYMDVIDKLHPLFLKYGVQIVFQGHDHYYARSVVNGIQYVTTGGGGAPLRDPHIPPDPEYPYLVYAERIHQFCEISIDGDVLSFMAKDTIIDVPNHDPIIDDFTIELYDENDYISIAESCADFIRNLQQGDGSIIGWPGSNIINHDSTMEYALMGLAAAYYETGNEDYLTALENGIAWLSDPDIQVLVHNDVDVNNPVDWYGSWFYSYNTDGSVSTNIDLTESKRLFSTDDTRTNYYNVRGVDTTTALYPYLLYLHYFITGDPTFYLQYKDNAVAALDFLINSNIDTTYVTGWGNKYAFSYWFQDEFASDPWVRENCQFTADQADVYLGVKAGSYLFPEKKGYADIAHYLENYLCTLANDQIDDYGFFKTNYNQVDFIDLYYTGRMDDDNGVPNFAIGYDPNYKFNGTFAQGYLPWVLGNNGNNTEAYNWMSGDPNWRVWFDPNWSDAYWLYFNHLLPENYNHQYIDFTSIIQYMNSGNDDPIYDDIFSLSSILYYMAGYTLDIDLNEEVLNWVVNSRYDDEDGGILDCLMIGDDWTKYINTAGFATMALTEFPTLLEKPQTDDITIYTNWSGPDPVFIGDDFTLASGVTLDINTDVHFLGGYDFKIEGTVNVNSGASINMMDGALIEVNTGGLMDLKWGCTIAGRKAGYYEGETWIDGDRIVAVDGGMISTDTDENYTPGDPLIYIKSNSTENWDGIFIENPDDGDNYWFVNCDISNIGNLSIEKTGFSPSNYSANLQLYKTDFHHCSQLIVQDAHVAVIDDCDIHHNQIGINIYHADFDIQYTNIYENDTGVSLNYVTDQESRILNCNINNNGCGIMNRDGEFELLNSTIDNNDYDGVKAYSVGEFSDIDGNYIHDNGYSEFAGFKVSYLSWVDGDNDVSDNSYTLPSDKYILKAMDWREGDDPIDVTGNDIMTSDPERFYPCFEAFEFDSGTPEEQKLLYASATEDMNSGNYQSATVKFETIISDYSETTEAIGSVQNLYFIENYTNRNYAQLIQYLESINVGFEDNLHRVIRDVITKSYMQGENYETAITRLEPVINNPANNDEYIDAIIDEAYSHYKLIENGSRGVLTDCTVRPNNYREFQEIVNSLFQEKIEEIEEPLNNDVITPKVTLSIYPNPFNPTTTINFSLPKDSKVELSIYNVKGQKVITVVDDFFEKGSHSIEWNGTDSSKKAVSSGIYFLNMSADKSTQMRKMLLLK